MSGARATIVLALSIAGATLCSPRSAMAQAVSIDAATTDQKEAAQSKLKEAMGDFSDKRFEEALAAFRASYGIVASPNSGLMVARSLVELGRLAEAYAWFGRLVPEADAASAKDPKYAEAARAAHKEQAALQGRVAKLTLQVVNAPTDTKIVVNDAVLDRASWDQPNIVNPGRITVVATWGKSHEIRQELTLDAAASGAVVLNFAQSGESAHAEASVVPASPSSSQTAPPPADARPAGSGKPRTLAYVAAGTGAVGFIAFGVLGAMNNSKFHDLEGACAGNHCPPDRSSDASSGKHLQTFANVGLAVGAVGLVTGGVLFFAGGGHEGSATSTTRPAVDVGVGWGTLRVDGRF